MSCWGTYCMLIIWLWILTSEHSREWGAVEARIACSASEACHCPYMWRRRGDGESCHPPVDPATSSRWKVSSSPPAWQWPCQRRGGHCYAWLTTPWQGYQMIWGKLADHHLRKYRVIISIHVHVLHRIIWYETCRSILGVSMDAFIKIHCLLSFFQNVRYMYITWISHNFTP